MAKFRKKPVVIEALQWDGTRVNETPGWIKEAINKDPNDKGSIFRLRNELHINTLEGVMIARPGDWIIRGVNGEIYPCKPDIFEKSYEPAE